MTIDEAKSRLLNTAWLGTDEDRDKTEEAVGVLFDAVKVIEDIKAEIKAIQTDDANIAKSRAIAIINKHIGEEKE